MNFRDLKGNSAFHLAIKTRQNTTGEFLKVKIYDYIPGSNDDGRKKAGLQNLIKSKNMKDKIDPLETAIGCCDHSNIFDMCENFVD